MNLLYYIIAFCSLKSTIFFLLFHTEQLNNGRERRNQSEEEGTEKQTLSGEKEIQTFQIFIPPKKMISTWNSF